MIILTFRSFFCSHWLTDKATGLNRCWAFFFDSFFDFKRCEFHSDSCLVFFSFCLHQCTFWDLCLRGKLSITTVFIRLRSIQIWFDTFKWNIFLILRVVAFVLLLFNELPLIYVYNFFFCSENSTAFIFQWIRNIFSYRHIALLR